MIDGCDRVVLARQMCRMHYERRRVHGDPLYKKPRPKPRNDFDVRGETAAIIIRSSVYGVVQSLIDSADLQKAKSCPNSWKVGKRTGGELVVMSFLRHGQKKQSIFLHRFIMDAPAGMDVDHINHDPLDNRRSNLRVVTRAQNLQNLVRGRKGSTSRYVGVDFQAEYAGGSRPWRARVMVSGREIFLGQFATEEEAAEVVADARRRLLPFSYEATMAERRAGAGG